MRIVDADAYYEELRSAGKIPGSFQDGDYKICEVKLVY